MTLDLETLADSRTKAPPEAVSLVNKCDVSSPVPGTGEDAAVLLMFSREAGALVLGQQPGLQEEQFCALLLRIWTELPEQGRKMYRMRAGQGKENVELGEK